MYMKRIFLLLFAVCMSALSYAQTEAIKSAEAAYMQEDFFKASELYEEILFNYGESAEIYYNLGNAYFKDGQIANAILNYERALLLDPGDGDIRFNLQMARARTVDQIEPIGRFFLVDWFHKVQNLGSISSWSAIGVVGFIAFIGCLILFFFSKWIHLKKIGFYVGLVLLVVIVFANIFAANQKNELVNRSYAIIFAPTITIKGSPDNSGTDLFVLREGTKVSVRSTLGSWSEIELQDGSIGWLPSKDIERI